MEESLKDDFLGMDDPEFFLGMEEPEDVLRGMGPGGGGGAE